MVGSLVNVTKPNYVRRVPKAVRHIDNRTLQKCASCDKVYEYVLYVPLPLEYLARPMCIDAYCAEYFPSFLLNGAAVMPCKITLKRTVVATTV